MVPGALYVAYRHGDAHVCDQGRLVVLRSRDGGVRFDIATVARGEADTRDAHLYSVEDHRLHVVGFVYGPHGGASGTAWTENGLNWSPWTPFTGTGNWILWRPEYFKSTSRCSCARNRPIRSGNKSSWTSR